MKLGPMSSNGDELVRRCGGVTTRSSRMGRTRRTCSDIVGPKWHNETKSDKTRETCRPQIKGYCTMAWDVWCTDEQLDIRFAWIRLIGRMTEGAHSTRSYQVGKNSLQKRGSSRNALQRHIVKWRRCSVQHRKGCLVQATSAAAAIAKFLQGSRRLALKGRRRPIQLRLRIQ